MIGMAVADQRVLERHPKAPPERGDIGGAELLVAEHQHRMLGEGLPDPAEGRVVEPGQIDPERFGAGRLAERAQFWCTGHCRSSPWAAMAGVASPTGTR